MASLASKDSYIQKLASKVCNPPSKERREKKYVPFQSRSPGAGGAKKISRKQKRSQGKTLHVNNKNIILTNQKPTPKPSPKPSANPAQKAPGTTAQQNASKPTVTNGSSAVKPKDGKARSTFSTVDLLRKRLHEKIEEQRGQGAPKDAMSEEVQAKRAKRKQERERKKQKRKEFRKKKLAEEAGLKLAAEIKQEEGAAPAPPVAGKRDETAIIFNKVETVEEGFVDKVQKKKEKKKSVKGNLTPLVGKNYKQLLGRVEARKAKLEHLRETNEEKAKVLEEKMKWTNVLYKAEGLKIKDNEDLLRKSLKRKEKMKSTRKKKWAERSGAVVEKMQRRQDKRRRNLTKLKQGKVEKKKQKARKKGRILPEDLKKAAV